MEVNEIIACTEFPCQDVHHDGYAIPDINLDPQPVSILITFESAHRFQDIISMPVMRQHIKNIQAFLDPGVDMNSIAEKVEIYSVIR